MRALLPLLLLAQAMPAAALDPLAGRIGEAVDIPPEDWAAMATGLRTLGLRVDETPDGATVHPGPLGGGTIESHGDHRIAMAFAVAAQRASGQVRIEDVANVATSFPGFDRLAAGCGFGLGG